MKNSIDIAVMIATLLAGLLPVLLSSAGRRPAVKPVRIEPERRAPRGD